MDTELDIGALIPSLAMGASASLLTWWVLSALRTDDLEQKDDEWRYDISRINELRRHDAMFRMFQPIIQFFAKLNRAAFRNQLAEVYRQIQTAGLPRTWLPEEYLGRMQVIALLLMPLYLYGCLVYIGPMGIVSGLFLTIVTVGILRRQLRISAERRLLNIKRRMPFFLDLLTLLIEAGSSFLLALRQAVKEFEGHPVATEFGRVLADMNMGKARTEAFDNMRQRLDDDEITSIVGAIIQSEELGTPISDIFRTQADVLRVKRSQRAETIAGEAGVNMLLPGVLVMAATILIILGPFMLNFFQMGFGI